MPKVRLDIRPIVEWLKPYSDEKLAALQAHTEDGKLRFNSCCCLCGSLTADHALAGEYWALGSMHYTAAMQIPNAKMVEATYNHLANVGRGKDRDDTRRRYLIPLIHAEWRRRAKAYRIRVRVWEIHDQACRIEEERK